jgi:hypothetical protein
MKKNYLLSISLESREGRGGIEGRRHRSVVGVRVW